MIKKPKEVIGVYDNGGRTIDRYTVVLNESGGFGLYGCFGLSNDPRFFSQYSSCMIGAHLGKRIGWKNLPAILKEHVIDRLG